MVKNLPTVQERGLIAGLERSPALENYTDRGTWWAPVHGAAKCQTQLSNNHIAFLPDLKPGLGH